MAKRVRGRTSVPLRFADAADRLTAALGGPARRQAIDALMDGAAPADAFAGLRTAMRRHTFVTAAGTISLRRIVDALDARTRREGLHVLHGWDFVAQRRPDDITPVLLLDYCERLGVPADRTREMLAVLLDQYFLALLSLLVVRAWDDGDANANLDRVSALIGLLQGGEGSGHRTVDDAETLILLAVAYYHPEEVAYDQMLDRITALDQAHALRFAIPCASVFGSHLRWGLRFMYRNDVGLMRDDNVVDYPWVLFTLDTLMREYVAQRGSPRTPDRDRVVVALLDALSADPWAFDGAVPACLAPYAARHAEFRALLDAHRDALLSDFEAFRPTARAYAPIGFECNFLSNAVVAMVATASGESGPGEPLNALFSVDSRARDSLTDSPAYRLAARLMDYATGDPARLAKGGAPLIVYDQHDATHFFNVVVQTLSRRREDA